MRGMQLEVPDYGTVRCCPYHGGWIRLADCPVVATNEQMRDRPQEAPAMSEVLGAPERAPEADIVLDLAAARENNESGLGRFVPGTFLRSRVDNRQRLIVAGPPK